MGRLVKCQYCQQSVDKDVAIRFEEKNFHEKCCQEYKDRKEIYKYVAHLFGFKSENKPGPVIIPGEETMTLSNAIAAAGGTTRLANTRSITVKRKLADGTSKTFDVDLRAILNDKNTHDFNLYDGDTVDVPEAIF